MRVSLNSLCNHAMSHWLSYWYSLKSWNTKEQDNFFLLKKLYKRVFFKEENANLKNSLLRVHSITLVVEQCIASEKVYKELAWHILKKKHLRNFYFTFHSSLKGVILTLTQISEVKIQIKGISILLYFNWASYDNSQ